MLPLALKVEVRCITLADLTAQQSERSAGHPCNLQLSLQRLQFGATGVTELPQRILAIHGPRLNLVSRQVGLRVRVHNSYYDLFCRLQNGLRRTEPNAAEQRVNR
jgi:hypothetical protein